jgi:hypothetical protein
MWHRYAPLPERPATFTERTLERSCEAKYISLPRLGIPERALTKGGAAQGAPSNRLHVIDAHSVCPSEAADSFCIA